MPTLVDVAGADYPAEFSGNKIQPMEGRSLRPFFDTRETEPRTLYWEHEGNRAIRDGDWKLVGQRNQPWELYHIAKDRTELTNLVDQEQGKAAELQAKWDAWANKVGVLTPDAFEQARKRSRK
jgi:arylsulfatase